MQLYQGHLGLQKAHIILPHCHGYITVIVPGQGTHKHLAAVQRLIQSDLHLAAHELLKIPGSLQLPLRPGGAHFKHIAVRNGVLLVQDGIQPAADGLAVIDADAALLVDEYPEIPAIFLSSR